jgi:ABC-type uncharacterized transport system involved in gliding motility auxiliary subunit
MSDETRPPAPDPTGAPRSEEGRLVEASLLETVGLAAGVIGLTALVFGALLYVLDPSARIITVINGGLGLTLVVFYVATNRRRLRRVASGRSTPLVLLELVLGAAVLVGVGVANYVAHHSDLEWDLTRDQLFTLDPQSSAAARRLTQDVAIIGFFKPSDATREQLRQLVELYRRESPHVRLRFENVDALTPKLAEQYKLTATGARIVVDAGNGRIAKAKSPTEAELTRALLEVLDRPVRRVYWLTGHGEIPLDDTTEAGMRRAIEATIDDGFEVRAFSLVGEESLPRDAAVVVLAGAEKALLPNEVAALRAYVAEGGRLALFVDPSTQLGLDPLLAENGVRLGSDLVVDPNPASRALGFGPDAPVVTKLEAHPITQPLKNAALLFYWVRSVSPTLVDGVTTTTLVQTPETSWAETAYQGGGDLERGPDELQGPVPIAVAIERRTTVGAERRTDGARLVVVGDSSFATTRFFGTGSNGDFFLNVLGWLAGEEASVTLRPKQRGATRVALTESQLYGVVFFSVNLLPLLLTGFGFSVWAVRRRK